jgi:hypothetical protein
LADVETVDNWIGEKLSEASSTLLDQIHQEIFESLPQERKDAIISETKESIPVDTSGKPELTPAYLRSIGRLDLLEWGTD